MSSIIIVNISSAQSSFHLSFINSKNLSMIGLALIPSLEIALLIKNMVELSVGMPLLFAHATNGATGGNFLPAFHPLLT